MAWFFQLNLHDRVRLLANPESDLPSSLVVELNRAGVGVASTSWAPHDSPTPFQLEPEAASALAKRRDALNRWWDGLPSEERSVLIENRHGVLPEHLKSVIQGGGGAVTEQRLENGELKPRLYVTPMTSVFLEWKANELV